MNFNMQGRDDETEWAAAQNRWCILRTSGQRTLVLVRSLNDAGIAAWTPTMTVRRKRPGGSKKSGAAPILMEVAVPIVTTFAFAPLASLPGVLAMRANRFNGLPEFSIMRLGNGPALVRDHNLGTLRDEEEIAASRYAALLQSEAEARTEVEQRLARVALLRNEQAKRKALRAVRREFADGDGVTVSGVPSFAGMTGIVKSGDGQSYVVRFGVALEIKIEAWQLDAVSVDDSLSHAD